jgi:hypothetical protein
MPVIDRQDDNSAEAAYEGNMLPEDNHIRGSMTLQEVAGCAGISVDQLRRILGVGQDVPAGERIGRLARSLGFTMADVRQRLFGN